MPLAIIILSLIVTRYDKGDLEEALKAVRNGDMTVHRAGHFFGIPHSTLEYKIKERNIIAQSPVSGEGGKQSRCSSVGSDDLAPSPLTPELTAKPKPVHETTVKQTVKHPLPTQMALNAFPMPICNGGGFNFGLTPLFFTTPFCDMLTATAAGFSGSQQSLMPFDTVTMPFFAGRGAAAAQLQPEKSVLTTGLFRPWAPEASSTKGTVNGREEILPLDDADSNEPLDLIKRSSALTVVHASD